MLVLLSAAVVATGGAETTRAAVQHDSCLSVDATAIGQNLGGGQTEATIVHAGS